MPVQLSGCITALATPFDDAGALDWNSWLRLIRQQLEGGVRGLVVAGSTGEAAMLTSEEFTALIRSAVDAVAGRVPVLRGAAIGFALSGIALVLNLVYNLAVDQAQAVALDVHAASGADGPGAGLGKKRRVDTLLFVKTPGAYADSGCRAVRAPGEKLAFAGLHPHGFASVGASARDGRIENPGVAA